MKKFQETMKNIGASVHITTQEKDAMRGKVFEYMKYKPIPHSDTQVVTATSFFSQFNTVFAVLVLVVVSGFGTSLAVPQAVPGDLLFSAKIAGEEIKMAVMSDEKERAVYAVERTYTRFAEQKRVVEGGGDVDSHYLEESIAKTEKELSSLADIDPARAQAINIAFEIGKEVRQGKTLALAGGNAMPVAESQSVDMAFGTFESSAESMRSMKTSMSEDMQVMALLSPPKDTTSEIAVLPKQSEIVLSAEVLQELIQVMENRVSTLDEMDVFTQERIGELRKEINTAMQRGDLVSVQRLVYDVLYSVERAAAGLNSMVPLEEEFEEPFNPNNIEVYELPNN